MKLLLVIGFVFSTAALEAQSPSFDAAVIKLAPPPSMGMMRVDATGGPGTKDPGLFRCENCTVSMLVMQAYDIKNYQMAGGAAALNGDRYNITARVPEGATKEEFRQMLRNLLADRFKLAVHHQKTELAGYDLVIAKGGPKLTPAAPVDPDAPPPDMSPGGPRLKMDKDGIPVLPKMAGRPITFLMNGRARSQGTDVSMADLATFLTAHVGGKPVNDATGLTGKYDYTLSFAPESNPGMMMIPPGSVGPHGEPAPPQDGEPPPSIYVALQEQLGLKLEPKKATVDILVVDHVEKAPTEN